MAYSRKPGKADIRRRIATHIAGGGTILAQKIRPAHMGGKHTVSLGPYSAAVDSPYRYAMITTGRDPRAHSLYRSRHPYEAASAFIELMGNEKALQALAQAQGKLRGIFPLPESAADQQSPADPAAQIGD